MNISGGTFAFPSPSKYLLQEQQGITIGTPFLFQLIGSTIFFFMNSRQMRKQQISVCVRKRPLTYTECRRGEADVVSTLDKACVTVNERKEAVDLSQYVLQVYIFTVLHLLIFKERTLTLFI